MTAIRDNGRAILPEQEVRDAQDFRQRYGEVVKHLSNDFSMPLDPGIKDAVLAVRDAGIGTYESCEGQAVALC